MAREGKVVLTSESRSNEIDEEIRVMNIIPNKLREIFSLIFCQGSGNVTSHEQPPHDEFSTRYAHVGP